MALSGIFWRSIGCIAAVALAAHSIESHAEATGPTFRIPRLSIDGGAQRAESQSYVITGTVGQPDAGAPAQGPTFTVRGGFFAKQAAPRLDALFADGFESPAARTPLD